MRAARSYREWAADGALVLGGGAAILLQLTDPVVAASVARHSRFETDPVGRLVGTLRYVYSVALGADDAAAVAASTVHRAHAGIPGADEPDRQLWVAATLYWAGCAAHDALRGPLDDAVADEVYRRSARLGTALHMPPEAWPPDRAAFDAWWAGRIAEVAVTEDARGVARSLLRPRTGPWWLRAAMPTARAVTVRMLPPAVRDAYRLRWTPAHERRSRSRMHVLRTLWGLTPRRIRELPARRLGGAGQRVS